MTNVEFFANLASPHWLLLFNPVKLKLDADFAVLKKMELHKSICDIRESPCSVNLKSYDPVISEHLCQVERLKAHLHDDKKCDIFALR